MNMSASQFPNCELRFHDVGFRRGERLLFSGMSFTLNSGTALWVQGSNGIGKTSVLKLAAGLTRPDNGSISWSVNHINTLPREVVAFQGHIDSFDPSLTAYEELSFWAETYDYDDEISDLLTRVNLGAQSDVKSGQLSAGQKRRLAFARILMSQRPIWLLDEPKAAMDRPGQDLIDALMMEHIARGGIIIIATHNLAKPIGRTARRLKLEAADMLIETP